MSKQRIVVVVTCLLLSHFTAPATLSADEWQPYRDPTGTLSMDVPASWRVQKPTVLPFGQIITFVLPEHSAEFTVSITPKLRLPEEFPLALAKGYFPPAAALDEPRRSKGEQWNAVRQEATLSSRAWLGMFYGADSTAVAITLSDDKGRIGTQRSIFDRIVHSVVLHQPSSEPPLPGA